MSASPEELRAQFLKLRESGAPLPKPAAVPSGTPRAVTPAREPWEIDRTAEPVAQQWQIAAGVAVLLGDGWTLRPADPDSRRWPTLDRAAGGAFYFSLDGKRLEIRGEWPKSEEDSTSFSYRRQEYGGAYCSITCALSRSAESIAGDIQRRFLPGYLEEWEHAQESCREHDQRYRNVERSARELAAILGTEPHPKYRHDSGARDHFSAGEYHDSKPWHLSGNLETYAPNGHSIKLEISCTEAVARGVLAFLAGLEE